LKANLTSIALFLCLIVPSDGRGETQIPFSGIAFTSELSLARDSMPYTFGIIGDEDSIKSTTFRKNLREKAEGKQLKNGAFLSANAQNRLKRGQALAVALAIERERMLETKLSDEEYQLSFDIDATILAFNFSEKAIVSSHPIKLTLLTSLSEKPTENDRSKLANIMFFGDREKEWFQDLSGSYLITEFMKAVQDTEIRQAWRSHIRVKNIDLSPQAAKVLKDLDQDPDYMRQLIASSISSSMSTRLKIPVLPYVKSQAIQSSMTLKFFETDLMNFKIPEASFHINLTVRGFGSKTLQETNRTRVVSYISGVQVNVRDIDFDASRMKQKFQAGNVKRLTASMTENLWHEYEQSLLSLLDQIVMQIDKPDKKWVEKKSSGNSKTRDVVKSLENVKKQVIDQVRS
jgi:hypothetical protein